MDGIKEEIDAKKAKLQKLEEHKIRRAAEWEQFLKEVNIYVMYLHPTRKCWDR